MENRQPAANPNGIIPQRETRLLRLKTAIQIQKDTKNLPPWNHISYPNRDEPSTLREENQKLPVRTPAVGDVLKTVKKGCPFLVSRGVVDHKGKL